MRINVITRHAPGNYGSLLQSIATQKIFKKLKYDCKIIDYVPEEETGARVAFTQIKGKINEKNNAIKKMINILLREPEYLIMHHKFLKMRRKYLNMTKHFKNHMELKENFANSKEIFITGSDQVWGPISNGKLDMAYFLDFVPDNAIRIAFASSFGKANFDRIIIDKIKDRLSKYNAITVREDKAVEIINKMGLEAKQVLDPTLLITSEEWSKYIIETKKNKKYILVYQIHNNRNLDMYAKKYAKKTGLPLVRVSPLLHQTIRGGKFIWLPEIGEFLGLIKNAECLITDSFHGTAFAINFNTQFVEVLPNTGTSSRNQSMLKLTGLENRIVNNLEDFSFIDKKICFLEVNKIIEKNREESLNYLETILNNEVKI
jgi:hypothetical protein